MDRAIQTWPAGSAVAPALNVFEAARPLPGERHLRGWEWYYFWRQTHTELRMLLGHAQAVNSVRWRPDSSQLTSCGDDGTVRLWESATGRLVWTMIGHQGPVHRVAFSPPDGRHLASAGKDGTIRIWDIHSGQPEQTLTGHTGGARCLAYSADGTLIASGGADAVVKLWSITSGQLLQTYRGPTQRITDVIFSADGHRLVAAADHIRSHNGTRIPRSY